MVTSFSGRLASRGRACVAREQCFPKSLFPLLAGRIARVAGGLALGFKCQFSGCGLFFFTCELCCGFCRGLGIAGLLLGLGGLAG